MTNPNPAHFDSYATKDNPDKADRRIRHRMCTAEQRDRDIAVLERLQEVFPLVSPKPDYSDFMTGAALALLVLRERENGLTP